MDVSKTAVQPKAPTSVARASVAPAAPPAKPVAPARSPTPAATVDISSEARARLQKAGASSSDISHVNLKDSRAVDRAVLKARTQHASADHKDAKPAATPVVATKSDAVPTNTKDAKPAATPVVATKSDAVPTKRK